MCSHPHYNLNCCTTSTEKNIKLIFMLNNAPPPAHHTHYHYHYMHRDNNRMVVHKYYVVHSFFLTSLPRLDLQRKKTGKVGRKYSAPLVASRMNVDSCFLSGCTYAQEISPFIPPLLYPYLLPTPTKNRLILHVSRC